jgi:hypothetical protein
LFIAAEHELEISGGWSAEVTVPEPPRIPEGPQVYTLEAYLTTAEGEPRFGAVTTIEIPSRP